MYGIIIADEVFKEKREHMESYENYERVMKMKTLKRKIFAICIYVVFAAVGGFAIFNTLNVYIAALAVILEAALILFTKKYLNVEIEYSFMGGIFTASKIFGKRSRKVLEEIDLSSCILIDYATADTLARVNSMNTSGSILDVSDINADGEAVVALWEVDKKRGAILFNADARTLKLLYRANAQSCSQAIRVKAR